MNTHEGRQAAVWDVRLGSTSSHHGAPGTRGPKLWGAFTSDAPRQTPEDCNNHQRLSRSNQTLKYTQRQNKQKRNTQQRQKKLQTKPSWTALFRLWLQVMNSDEGRGSVIGRDHFSGWPDWTFFEFFSILCIKIVLVVKYFI